MAAKESTMKLKKWVIAAGGALSVTAVFALFTSSTAKFHTREEMRMFGELPDSLPAYFNGLFATSGTCTECHGHDPAGLASVTLGGEDVNIVDAWRSTMMANSAKDPYWRAKVRQEVLTNPGHQEVIENTCTKCHAPLGRHAIEVTGLSDYSFAHMLTDTAGLDGVSCVACHQQSTFNLANEHSGNLHFEQTQIAYGPFESPLSSVMEFASGYIPVQSAHISDAGICAGCHSLITETADLEGNLTGGTFIEQATYLEWENSAYDNGQELATTCQDCHMPQLSEKDPIQLAAGFDTPFRAPFSKHTFAGANMLMLKLMRDNRDTLHISATSADYDATIDATANMLKDGLDMNVEVVDRDADTLYVEVTLENLAGHKYPSGYPARRLFLQVLVTNPETGEVVFSSGELAADNSLPDENSPFEPHYDVVRSENDVQIYEMVMGDVNGDPTTVLERGAVHLKDNRLVPIGFKTSDAQYDSTAIVGEAFNDPNFNYENGLEGSGTDKVRYHIPVNGVYDGLEVSVIANYHSIPPKWVAELFTWDDPFVNHFEEMFGEADTAPFQVEVDAVNAAPYVGILKPKKPAIEVYGYQQEIIVRNVNNAHVSIFTVAGQLVKEADIVGQNSRIGIPVVAGIYLVILETDGQQFVKKVYIPEPNK